MIANGFIVMLYITGGDLKEGRAGELQDWVQENEGTLADTSPPGWTYRGTYFTVHNVGPFDAAVMWEIESYADLDTAREHDDDTYVDLLREAQDFFIAGSTDTIIFREAGDTRIVEPE